MSGYIKKLALSLHLKGEIDKAYELYSEIIEDAIDADFEVFANISAISNMRKEYHQAIIYIEKAISLKGNFYQGHYNLGNLLYQIKDNERAIQSYKNAIDYKIDYWESYLNLGRIYEEIGNLDEAKNCYHNVIKINKNEFKGYYNMANIEYKLGNFSEAIKLYKVALKINSKFKEAYLNFAKLLILIKNYNEAEKLLKIGISGISDNAELCAYLGIVHQKRGDPLNASILYRKAISNDNNLNWVKANTIYNEIGICDWTFYDQNLTWLDDLSGENMKIDPFGLLAIDNNPLRQLIRAKNFSKNSFISNKNIIKNKKKDKIRIGYFSNNFHESAMMHLMCRVFELHNKSLFEVFIYSYGINKADKYITRLKSSVDQFYDISNINDQKATDIIRSHKLDLAIDLMGHTKDSRLQIFANRIAEIQISYLGYPGSLGADFIDYIIADKIVIPEINKKYYHEKIVYMPNSYFVNNDLKEISSKEFTRQDFGIPNNSFVFTCFNANYKISPKEFAIWMRLLLKIENSVLWLIESNQFSSRNLIKEAQKYGVSYNKLIFAKKIELSEHLKRHQLGDLYLDTFIYNGHTSASDSLWAGLPVLTMCGETFTSRVCSSLLNSLSMNELVTSNERDYEEKAIEIAENNELLTSLKIKLNKQIKRSSLFKSDQFTSDLENCYLRLINNE